jgi:outer membrane protein
LINPQYNDDVFFEITQPFLRGFGLDVTKSEIQLRKLDQQVAQERYVRQVQQTIQQVEQAYWNLVQARRLLPVASELLAQTQRVLTYFEIRKQFDVQPVQIANTQARLENRRAELIAAIYHIRDAEAQLKALINDPSLPTPADQEIIPTDIPALQAVVLNRMVELKTAMENRPELAQARYAVDSARVGVTVASNQRLPKLDVFFRYTANGLSSNPDASFEQMSTNDFVDYMIGVQFEYPIGNRAAEAGYRQARLTMAQAVASVKQVVEQVILEVDVAYRNLETQLKQVLPNAGAVIAEEANLTAIQQRTDRRDPTFLDLELNTQSSLALTRQNLLSTWVQYSIGIVNIEFAKGTLLAYNNVRLEPRWDDPAAQK